MEVGQENVLNTFGLGRCMKALPLIWKFQDEYRMHVATPGPFHTGMNYMGMVTGHKYMGSEYDEIFTEAELITNGCLASVLSVKTYAKALCCLKIVTEAMERLLILSSQLIHTTLTPSRLRRDCAATSPNSIS